MKRTLIIAAFAALLIALPGTASAYYLIQLDNGRQIATSECWEEGSMVMFVYKGGTVGVFKEHVKDITRSLLPVPEEDAFEPAVAEPAPAPAPEATVKMKTVALNASATPRDQKLFTEDFKALRARYENVMSMSSDELLTFAKDIFKLRDKILRMQMGNEYGDEFMSMYSMADTVEETLNQRQKSGFKY